MYCIGTIKQVKYGYFGIQAVSIPPCPNTNFHLYIINHKCIHISFSMFKLYNTIPYIQKTLQIHDIKVKTFSYSNCAYKIEQIHTYL